MSHRHDEPGDVRVAAGHRLKGGATGLVGVLFMATHPEEYARLGRTVLDDARER